MARRCWLGLRSDRSGDDAPADYYEKILVHHGVHGRAAHTHESNCGHLSPTSWERTAWEALSTRCHNGDVSTSSDHSTHDAPTSGTTASVDATTADGTEAREVVELPQVFRVQKLAYFTVPAAFIVVIILSGASLVWLGWTLVLPVLLAVWIARVRTIVTEDGITAVGTFRTKQVPWSDLAGLQFSKWGPVRAVLTDESRVRLPALMFRDLPRLSAASRGRIPDPYAAAAAAED